MLKRVAVGVGGGIGGYDYGSGGSFDQLNAPWESFFNQPQETTNFWTPPP